MTINIKPIHAVAATYMLGAFFTLGYIVFYCGLDANNVWKHIASAIFWPVVLPFMIF